MDIVSFECFYGRNLIMLRICAVIVDFGFKLVIFWGSLLTNEAVMPCFCYSYDY